MDEEINIIGGGIDGLAYAIILRENEYKVNVYEKVITLVRGSTKTGKVWRTGLRELMF